MVIVRFTGAGAGADIPFFLFCLTCSHLLCCKL
jgi:hypothetical protein